MTNSDTLQFILLLVIWLVAGKIASLLFYKRLDSDPQVTQEERDECRAPLANIVIVFSGVVGLIIETYKAIHR